MISSIGTYQLYWGQQQPAICMCVAHICGTNLVLQIIHNSECTHVPTYTAGVL